jgi:glucokinase
VRQVLAVDFGGTKTALARVDEHGTLTGSHRVPAARSLDESVEQIVAAAVDVEAVGVIVPGIYTRETGSAWCPNLWGLDEVPLRRALEDRLAVDVVIDNDRAGYVLGEAWLGVARGLRDVVFVSIGTGIGVGILADGRVVNGAHGIAGAAGWCALNPEWKEGYKLSGCWESEAAGSGVARQAQASDAAAVVEAARAGDRHAIEIMQQAAHYTGMGVANLISILNPEAVVLGGGFLLGAGDLLLGPIRAEAARWAQPIAAARCRIELTRLGEHAGLIGAARLALDRT